MKSCENCSCRIHFRVLYFLTTLLFLLGFSNLFISIYSPHRSDSRDRSTEMRKFDTEKWIKDEDANFNQKTIAHRVEKREISSIKSEDTIQLTGNWNIKKSDLWEYCFSAEDFCRRNGSGIKRSDGEENKEDEKIPKEDCFINEVGEREPINMEFIPEQDEHWIADPFQDLAGDEFSIWIKRVNSLSEYRISSNLTFYSTGNEYPLPSSDLSIYSGIVYNDYYFYQYKWEKTIVKVNLTAKRVVMMKELNDGFPFERGSIFFHSDEYDLWLVYLLQNNNQVVWMRINPETLEVLSKHNSSFILYQGSLAFVAFGKLYFPELFRFEKKATVYSLIDFYERNDKNLSLKFNVTGELYLVVYDWKSRYLYVYQNKGVFRYKVYFRCLNEQDSL